MRRVFTGRDEIEDQRVRAQRLLLGAAARGPEQRRGEEQVSVEWLAQRLQAFVDRNPAFEDAVERLASFLARDDEE